MGKNYSIFERNDEQNTDERTLVGATVIAAMAYQAAISPPGGVAQTDSEMNLAPRAQNAYLYALQPGASLLAYFYSDLSDVFWISNTISLMAALSIIFLHVSGFSLKRKIEIWLIRVMMWITLSAMTVAYVCAVCSTTPKDDIDKLTQTLRALIAGVMAWVILLFLSFFVLLFRCIRYFVRKNRNKDKSQVPACPDT